MKAAQKKQEERLANHASLEEQNQWFKEAHNELDQEMSLIDNLVRKLKRYLEI